MALGLLLIAMAAPRLAAGLIVAPHVATLQQLAAGRGVEGAALAAAARDYEDALAWHDEAGFAAELAGLNYALARGVGAGSEAGRAFLERGVAAARRALARSPAQPYTWLQLALALEILEGSGERSTAALVQSLRRGPYQPRIALPRAVMALRAWSLLDPEARDLANLQILLAARQNPAALAAAVPSPSLWRVVQDALLAEPALLQKVTAAR